MFTQAIPVIFLARLLEGTSQKRSQKFELSKREKVNRPPYYTCTAPLQAWLTSEASFTDTCKTNGKIWCALVPNFVGTRTLDIRELNRSPTMPSFCIKGESFLMLSGENATIKTELMWANEWWGRDSFDISGKNPTKIAISLKTIRQQRLNLSKLSKTKPVSTQYHPLFLNPFRIMINISNNREPTINKFNQAKLIFRPQIRKNVFINFIPWLFTQFSFQDINLQILTG